MISPQEIYVQFLIKINKNATGSGVTCDRSKFVLIFNECKNRWVETHLKSKDSILIDSIQEVIKPEKFLNGTVTDTYVEYPLTNDFYELIGGSCKAQKGECKGKVYIREIKNQDKWLLEFDEFSKPDFDYEWTFCTIQGNSIRVYKDEFDVLETNIEYYSVISDIDIEGYIKIDGTASTNVPINLSKQYVDQIVNLAAEEFERNIMNPLGLQLAKDRTQNQE